MKDRIDLSRRQVIKAGVAGLGLFGMSELSRVVLAEEEKEDGLDKALRKGSKIPYIGLAEDGPLYPPVEIPWLKDLTAVGAEGGKPKGQVLYLFGRIFEASGRPLPGATVEIWQCDNNGTYKHPRVDKPLDANFGYFGKVKTGEDGSYLFKTIVPRWYDMFGTKRAPHIHLKMRHRKHGVLTTETYFHGKEDEDIRKKDRVFLSRFTPDRMIVEKESPAKYKDLKLSFDRDAACCKYDLAFIL